MNDLEQWLADVRQFNVDVNEWWLDIGPLTEQRGEIVNRGEALGLRVTKIKPMLARVKLTVTMPEEGDATPKT